MLAFICTIGSAYLSDRWQTRGVFNVGWMALTAVGYIILISINSSEKPGVAYFALFLTVGAVSPGISNTITFTGNNLGGVYKRAAGMGFVFSCGNSAGIVSSLIYRTQDSPRFIPGHATCLAFALIASGLSAFMTWDLRRENARRDALYGDTPSSISPNTVGHEKYQEQLKVWGIDGLTDEQVSRLGDRHPGFRYIS